MGFRQTWLFALGMPCPHFCVPSASELHVAEGVKIAKVQGLDLNLKYEASWVLLVVCLVGWGMRDGGLRVSHISQGGLEFTV